MKINQILKYFDLFGTKCSFFVEKTPKLYSVIGGILSIMNICFCFLIFLYASLDDFLRMNPTVSISSIQPSYHQKIKFGEEKIWIPWRIKDYSNHFVNHTNLFYPFVYNYYSIRKSYGTGFEFRVKQLNYTLCNQTSFMNKSEIFYIDSSLDELYCIQMDDVIVGGDWTSDYISYIEFDLYLCKGGINYDINNPDCTRYENISNYLGKNNSLAMSLYYPIVQFKSNETINPMEVIYRERLYHISRYSNKIDRIFLQKNILKDDLGWLTNNYNVTSYWGLNSFTGDSYTTGKEKDLMNEGSTSRVYSFNIYIEPTINTYYRSYKKIYIILSESIPLIYIISFVFKLIAKFCKFHTINKKFSEFLFVNLKEKSDIFDKKIKELKELKEKSPSNYKKSNNHSNKNNINNNNPKYSNKNSNNFINENNEKNIENNNKLLIKKNSIIMNKLHQANEKSGKNNFHDNSLEILYNNRQKDLLSSKSLDHKDENNIARKTIKTYFNLRHKKEISYNEAKKNKRNSVKKISFVGNTQIRIQTVNKQKTEQNKHYVHKKLFPSRYYFYVIFIKNLDVLNKVKCVSKKFSKTYLFISKLLDIYSYLDLLRQFNVFKTCFLNDKSLSFIEKNRKINIGEMSFMKNIRECIENNNFHLFGKMKEEK